MTENVTSKLKLPIPQVTRGGDVNDLIDVRNTVEDILNYLDAGSGDYLTKQWASTSAGGAHTPYVLAGNSIVPFSTVVGTDMIVPVVEQDPAKIGWEADGESDYASIGTNGSVTIKKAGNYRIYGSCFYSTVDTAGAVAVSLARTDVQDSIDSGKVYTTEAVPINTGDYVGAVFFGGALRAGGWIGPHFYQEGAVVTPGLIVTDAGSEITVAMLNVGVERL